MRLGKLIYTKLEFVCLNEVVTYAGSDSSVLGRYVLHALVSYHHYVSVLIKFSQKTSVFTLIIIKSIKSYVLDVY